MREEMTIKMRLIALEKDTCNQKSLTYPIQC
jgi:hypothetical protein